MFQLNYDALLKKNTIKCTFPSPLKTAIFKQQVTRDRKKCCDVWKSHYNSFKINITFLNVCQTCLLVFNTQVCDSFIHLENVYSFLKTVFVLCMCMLHTPSPNYECHHWLKIFQRKPQVLQVCDSITRTNKCSICIHICLWRTHELFLHRDTWRIWKTIQISLIKTMNVFP